MDPAHTLSPETRLELIEQKMQEHEARFAMAAAEIQQTMTLQVEGLATLESQVQQPMVEFTTVTAATLLPPPAQTPAPTLSPPVLSSDPKSWVDNPGCYAGDPEGCNPSITNCSIIYTV